MSRMKVDEWQAEVNRMCLAAFCLESMYRAVDEAGDPLFPDCIMQKLSVSIIEGCLGQKKRCSQTNTTCRAKRDGIGATFC